MENNRRKNTKMLNIFTVERKKKNKTTSVTESKIKYFHWLPSITIMTVRKSFVIA